MNFFEHCILPEWPAAPNVRALQTTRSGGGSATPYDTFNLGDHVGDVPQCVAHNRQLLAARMPSEPVWLRQVHGTQVVDADSAGCEVTADAAIARHRGTVCGVLTADCLPILLSDEAGSVVGAVHAGWRGLVAGVIESTVTSMAVAPDKIMAWLGPAIGPQAFEVGAEVRNAFIAHHPLSDAFFKAADGDRQGKFFADLYGLARLRLNAIGVMRIYGGGLCTYRDTANFFSYRRDGITGRMGSFIWLE